METHENIRRLREALGLSQEALAERVGYRDRSSVAKVEAGQVDLSQSKIALFAEALNVSPAQLMGIGVGLSVEQDKSPESLTSDERLLLERFRQLNVDGKTFVLDNAEYALSRYPLKKDTPSQARVG